ncbi:N domain-containing protein [Fusarium mexicanum]|uniref:N domain-containing protein n=1 Tax=Fusarium mexicanum TaxID=751941 RepID=A0A8H5N7C0_9HYPO|nr:N domain-containing protein [Fusarium mexicanum]
MHILLLSSSNHNSARIIQSALFRNFTIAFLTPQLSQFPHHPDVTLINGLPASQHDLEIALQTPKPPEAVILAFYNTHVLEAVTHTLIRALKAIQTTKVNEEKDSTAMPLRLVFIQSNAMQLEADGYKRVDKIVRESGLPFDLAQCPRLTGELSAAVRASPGEGRVAAWLATVKKARMAHFQQDKARENKSNARDESAVGDIKLR